jgi:hypothetical protein
MDGRRVISLYRAADPKSVHLLQRGMPLPLDRVWPCTLIHPGWPGSK